MQEVIVTYYSLAHTIEQAAKISTLGRTSVYAAIKSGELRARKAGRRTVILDDDLRQWLSSLRSMHAT